MARLTRRQARRLALQRRAADRRRRRAIQAKRIAARKKRRAELQRRRRLGKTTTSTSREQVGTVFKTTVGSPFQPVRVPIIKEVTRTIRQPDVVKTKRQIRIERLNAKIAARRAARRRRALRRRRRRR